MVGPPNERPSQSEQDRRPSKSPSTLKSSSMSGQCMPSPSPSSSQLLRASSLAWQSLGNQTTGTDRRRPSTSSTTSSSCVTSTLCALGVISTTEERIPCLQESSFILSIQVLDLTQLVSGKPPRTSQYNGTQPILRQPAIPLNMNVRRLITFVTVEEKAIRTNSSNRRHVTLYTAASERQCLR